MGGAGLDTNVEAEITPEVETNVECTPGGLDVDLNLGSTSAGFGFGGGLGGSANLDVGAGLDTNVETEITPEVETNLEYTPGTLDIDNGSSGGISFGGSFGV